MVIGFIFTKLVLIKSGLSIHFLEDSRSHESDEDTIGISGFESICNPGAVIEKKSMFDYTRQLISVNIVFNVKG